MIKFVLVRHGQSIWNLENRFTGWTDVPLSEKGIKEAQEAGMVLKEKGFTFDLAFTSVLKRAEDTLDYILKEMDLSDIEVTDDYLNRIEVKYKPQYEKILGYLGDLEEER